jgi:hypothetical protein
MKEEDEREREKVRCGWAWWTLQGRWSGWFPRERPFEPCQKGKGRRGFGGSNNRQTAIRNNRGLDRRKKRILLANGNMCFFFCFFCSSFFSFPSFSSHASLCLPARFVFTQSNPLCSALCAFKEHGDESVHPLALLPPRHSRLFLHPSDHPLTPPSLYLPPPNTVEKPLRVRAVPEGVF